MSSLIILTLILDVQFRHWRSYAYLTFFLVLFVKKFYGFRIAKMLKVLEGSHISKYGPTKSIKYLWYCMKPLIKTVYCFFRSLFCSFWTAFLLPKRRLHLFLPPDTHKKGPLNIRPHTILRRHPKSQKTSLSLLGFCEGSPTEFSPFQKEGDFSSVE